MNANGTSISVAGLRFRYDTDTPIVLHDVSLDIPACTVTAILGPNGCGKTTLLHILLGLLMPESGRLLMAGRHREDYTRRELSQLLAFVPQDEQIAFDLSVLEFVLLGRAPYLGLLELPTEDDRELAERAMAATGVRALRNRSVPALSGGERQMVTVARALAQEAEILLLDEPTSHLDLANKHRVLEMTRALGREGKTVVLTTHDPNSATAVAGHVVLMRDGQVLASGPIEDVFTSENLSATYGIDVEVVLVHGKPFVVTQ